MPEKPISCVSYKIDESHVASSILQCICSSIPYKLLQNFMGHASLFLVTPSLCLSEQVGHLVCCYSSVHVATIAASSFFVHASSNNQWNGQNTEGTQQQPNSIAQSSVHAKSSLYDMTRWTRSETGALVPVVHWNSGQDIMNSKNENRVLTVPIT